jgi:hypothetical protein
MIIKIDQSPGNVAIILKRGFDLRPITVEFKAVILNNRKNYVF